ncbi:signal peptidase II [Candidatus Mycoplasma mahonii]|uniref:signal peptidase II n=1 Tax=Candidatus Mycoplasma mahonii TaxID=3004105 RepID=UPI0026F21A15|nr:signal peptidase II [Candidatus Mycoplasma mahonii]WKX02807.1 signal peptidase II [Candidatus Mycoplasma mahonii]
MINKIYYKWIFFGLIFLILLAADQSLKHFFFNEPFDEIQHDFKFIGIRANLHYGTTMFDMLNIPISNFWSIVLFAALAVIFLVILFFTRSPWVIISLSILIAGIFGNGLDNIFKGYVRNIIFMPLRDLGTFNLADIFVVIGAPLTGITLIFTSFKKKA